MPGLKILRKWQAGLEVTRGTAIAATRKFHATGALEKAQPGFWPALDVGSFDQRRDRYPLLIEAGGQAVCPVSFEDVAWWMQLAAKGAVAGVQEAATTAYRYTHTPSTDSDDVKTATFEWGDDFQAWRAPFGMVSKLEIKGAANSALEMTATIIAKDRETTAFTAALTDRQVEVVLGRRATLYIDEPGGVIGTTAVAGRLLGIEHALDIAPDRFYTMDDADGGKISDLLRGARLASTKLLYRFNNRAEYDKWAANTERLVSVKFVGADAGVGFPRRFQIYAPGYYEDAKIGEQGNSVTVEMTLNQRYSASLGYATKYESVNALAVLV